MKPYIVILNCSLTLEIIFIQSSVKNSEFVLETFKDRDPRFFCETVLCGGDLVYRNNLIFLNTHYIQYVSSKIGNQLFINGLKQSDSIYTKSLKKTVDE